MLRYNIGKRDYRHISGNKLRPFFFSGTENECHSVKRSVANINSGNVVFDKSRETRDTLRAPRHDVHSVCKLGAPSDRF